MGKSEILMLLAGVALSVMLAMVVVPMFSSGNEMADRQQVQQDLMSIKSSIPLVLALEGDDNNKFNSTNIQRHVTGFIQSTAPAAPHNGIIKNTKTGSDATYTLLDNGKTTKTITITVATTATTGVDLRKLTRLESICDHSYGGANATNKAPLATSLICVMKR